MAQAALPLMIGGGLLSSYSNYEQGQIASRRATQQATIDNYNAGLAEQAANRAQSVGQLKAKETQRQTRLMQSRQIALAASQGASVSEKNIADLISRTAAQGDYASMIDIYEGNLKADALRNEALSYRLRADSTQAEGRAARRAGNTRATSGLIQTGAGASSFYGKYNRAPSDSDLYNLYS